MSIAVTRLAPSLNGPLHLGHIVALLINEQFAHSVGGKVYVRFDDISHHSVKSGRHQRIMDEQKFDIEWLGIPIDDWQTDSAYEQNALELLKKANFPMLPEDETKEYVFPQSMRLGSTYISYPFCPRQTAVRVVIDHMTGITHLIRGDDFLAEFSYYHFVSDWMKYYSGEPYMMPEYYCVPRLESSQGDISKTNGGFTVAEFRARGYSAEDILEMLAKACLVGPVNGWSFFNLKKNPLLVV